MASRSRTLSIENDKKEREFLRKCGEKLEWGTLDGHVVMDVGCGDGKSAMNIVNLFPDVTRVVGIDYNKQKIAMAKRAHPHKLIEYRYADIHVRSNMNRWDDVFTKLISIFSLQQFRDQMTAFRHFYRLLKYDGEAVVVFKLQSGHYDWFTEITSHPKWKAYAKGFSKQIPDSHEKKLGSDHFENLFIEVGFRVIVCKEESSTCTYNSDDELKAAIFTACPMTSNIPKDLMDEFQEDSFQAFLKHNKRDTLGRPCVLNNNFVAILKKVSPGECN